MKEMWILLFVGLLVAACATTQAPRSEAVPEVRWEQVDRADGETLYGNLCASCHGAGGRGDGPVADVLTVTVPDLTGLAAANGGRFPLDRVEESIRGERAPAVHGPRGMPLWGPALEGVFDDMPHVNREAFAANRIRRLSRYIESLQAVGG